MWPIAQDTLVDSLHSLTCGWPPFAAAPIPAVIVRIEERLSDESVGYAAETARDGLALLKQWIHECDPTASREAVQELRRAFNRAPSNPVLQAALGVALARGIEVQLPQAHGHNYRPAHPESNAEREAARLLARVVEAWPAPELGLELAALGLATRDEATLEAATGALRTLTEERPEDRSVWTARAEVALARHEYAEAREAAGRGARLGDPSAFRAIGVTLLLTDDDPAEGGRMYLEGLSSADEEALYRYHEDIAPLLLPGDELEWASLAGDKRKTWLREGWEWRSSTAARTVAERLAVHFERLETAIDRYRRLAHRGARPFEALVWDSLQLRLPYDDRGLIHIRHGEPDAIVRAPSGRMGPGKEAWLYFGLSGGRAVFEFRKLKDWSDYVLAPPGECDPFVYMYGEGGAVGRMKYLSDEMPNTEWIGEYERGVLDYGLQLAAADPAIGTTAALCMGYILKAAGKNPVISGIPRNPRDPLFSVDTMWTDMLREELPYISLADAMRRRDARARVDEALATETATPRFANFIQALSSVYTFRGDDEQATVAAFLLLPAGQLTPRLLEPGVEYPLRLSLAIEDNAEQRVQRMDTLVTFGVGAPLGEGQFLRTTLQMPATPVLNATVRITVANADHPDEGQILVGTKPVPMYPPGALSMSDLVVAEPGPGSWRRGAVAINPLPGHQLEADASFRLFYEVYGLKPNEPIRTRLTVAPGTDPGLLARVKGLFGEQRVLELSFTETGQPGPDGTLQVERTITPSLEPGRYALEVTVERADSGRVVTMQTSIVLIENRAVRSSR